LLDCSFSGQSTFRRFSWENAFRNRLPSFPSSLCKAPFGTTFVIEGKLTMLQDPVNQDVFATPRPSPWPYVCAILGAAALVTTLMMAFSS